MRFFAMGRPMMPSPMNPMVCAMAPPTEDGYAGENPREHWTLSRAPQRSNTRRAKGSRWIAPGTFHPRLENPDRRQLRRRARERVRRQDEQIRALTGFETPGDRVDARGARSAERVGLECFRDGHRLVGRRDVAIAARARDRGRDTQERRVRAAGEVRRERLLHAGAQQAFSSDFPCGSNAPLLGIAAAVTRTSRDGHVAAPDEAMSVAEALEAYTLGAARAAGIDAVAGSLEPGKRADLLVLSSNPLACAPTELPAIRILETWMKGVRSDPP